METAYRAIIKEMGEILECDNFKDVYRFGLRHGKDYIRDHFWSDCFSIVIEFDKVVYSDYEYINKYGYPQHDIIQQDVVAYLAISRTGYTIDYADRDYDVIRPGA